MFDKGEPSVTAESALGSSGTCPPPKIRMTYFFRSLNLRQVKNMCSFVFSRHHRHTDTTDCKRRCFTTSSLPMFGISLSTAVAAMVAQSKINLTYSIITVSVYLQFQVKNQNLNLHKIYFESFKLELFKN